MIRSSRCRNAAAAILHTAARRLIPAGPPPKGDPRHEERQQAMIDAKRDIEGVLYETFAGSPEHAINDLLEEARIHERNVNTSGYDPKEDDPDFRSPADRLSRAMAEGLRQLDELTQHVCAYAEDEDSGDLLCGVCGSSGLT